MTEDAGGRWVALGQRLVIFAQKPNRRVDNRWHLVLKEGLDVKSLATGESVWTVAYCQERGLVSCFATMEDRRDAYSCYGITTTFCQRCLTQYDRTH